MAMVLDKTIAEKQSRGRSSIPVQGWTSCLLLPLQLLQGTRSLKEGFLPSAFMGGNSLSMMHHILSTVYIGVWRQVLRISVLWRGQSKIAVEV